MSTQLRKQALSIFTFVLGLIGVGMVLQLWLLGASLEAFQRGQTDLELPTALASLVILGVNAGLLTCVLRVDRRLA